MNFDLTVVNNHLLVRLPDGLALLDTGSPQSYGPGEYLQIGDRRHTLSTDGFGVLELVREKVSPDIQYFVGYETLKDYRVLIDWPGSKVVFSTDPIELPGAGELEMETIMGVPLIPIEVAGARTMAILDTGAALSYAPADAIENLEPIRTERDFYPMMGEFETGVWNLEGQFPHRRLAFEAGTLPPLLALTLGMIGGGWILGVDFFRNRRIALDYPGARVVDSE